MRSSDDSVVLELAGCPGAGKTAIAPFVVARLRQLGAPAVDASLRPGGGVARIGRLTSKAAHLTGIVASRPMASARVAAALRRGGLGGRELVARTTNLLVTASLHRFRSSRATVVVLDQGWVQELVSVGMTAEWRPAATAVRSLAGGRWPTVVVVVDAPAVVLLARLRGRPGHQSRLERLGDVALEREIDRVASLVEDVVDFVGAPVLRVDNGHGTPERSAELVAARALSRS